MTGWIKRLGLASAVAAIGGFLTLSLPVVAQLNTPFYTDAVGVAHFLQNPVLGGCTNPGQPNGCQVGQGAVFTNPATFPLSVGNGGTGTGTPGGTALDNITGFSSNGLVERTGAGTYSLDAIPLAVAKGGSGVTVAPARSSSAVASPAGTSSVGTFVMMGLSGSFTPVTSGKALITISGFCNNSVATDSGQLKITTGTGGAPSNGAAATGTVQGQAIQATSATASASVPFSQTVFVTGLTLSTAIWIDLQFDAIVGGTFTCASLNITAIEE